MTIPYLEDLMRRFELQRVEKSEWTHEAHLAAAIWYNWHLSKDAALSKIRDLILAHNVAVGTPNSDTGGYHESITSFYMFVAQKFISQNKFHTVDEACNAFISSDVAGRDAPLALWSKELLFSTEARRNKVNPDRGFLEGF